MSEYDTPQTRKPEIKSVTKALLILEYLTQHNDSPLIEISRKLSIEKSTVYRLLQTMKEKKVIHQDPYTGRYSLGIKTIEFAGSMLNSMGLPKVSRKVMIDLHNKYKEAVNLAIVDDIYIMYIEKLESVGPLRIGLTVGSKHPIYCSGLGKAILAFSPEAHALLKNIEFFRYTDKTITNREELEAQLADIRTKGYALDDEEYVNGIRCVAVPIWNHTGNVSASLSIAAPTVRLDDETVISVVEDLMKGTKEISSNLGYNGPIVGLKDE